MSFGYCAGLKAGEFVGEDYLPNGGMAFRELDVRFLAGAPRVGVEAQPTSNSLAMLAWVLVSNGYSCFGVGSPGRLFCHG